MSDELYPDELLGARPGQSGSYGIARCADWLRQIGDPAVLESAADVLERAGNLGLIMFFPHVCDEDLLPEVVEELRSFAAEARRSLEMIEAFGLTWDFERGRATFPSKRRGKKRELGTELVGAAFRELYPGTWKGQFDRETLARLRGRLVYLLPDDELTDKALKSRLQRYRRRSVS